MFACDPLVPGLPSRYAQWIHARGRNGSNAFGTASLCGAIGGFSLTLLGATTSGAAAAALIGGILGIVASRAHGSEAEKVAHLIARLDGARERRRVIGQLLDELADLRAPLREDEGWAGGYALLALAAAGALRDCGCTAESAELLDGLSPAWTSECEWQLRCVLRVEMWLTCGDFERARHALTDVQRKPDAVLPPVLEALVLACAGDAEAALERLPARRGPSARAWTAFTAARARANAFALQGDEHRTRRALRAVRHWGGAKALEQIALSAAPASRTAHAMLTRTVAYR